MPADHADYAEKRACFGVNGPVGIPPAPLFFSFSVLFEAFEFKIFEDGQTFFDHLHCFTIHHLVITVVFAQDIVQALSDRVKIVQIVFSSP